MARFAPQPWKPAPAPALVGPFEHNDRLAAARLVEVGEGPEDVLLGEDGAAYCGTKDGRIMTLDAKGTPALFAEVGGRPLGLEWHGEDLLVCNAERGLQRVSPKGAVQTIVDAHEGRRFRFTNNASVADDGTIYFTDTSTRWGIEEYVNDLLEGQTTGRLFRCTPAGALTVLLDDLQFANGVALAPDGQSVFVAETGKYRVRRHWLSGAREGQTEIFVDNLPGFPDNLSIGDGILWISLASPRQRIVDLIAPRGWLRHVSYRMPEALKPKPVRHGMVLGYAVDGRLVHNLQDRTGRVAITTSARWHDGSLYIGSLSEPHVAVFRLG